MTAILLYLTFIGYTSSHVRQFNNGPDNLFAAYFASLSYSYGMIFGSLPKLNGVAWSLEIEVQFYVIAPALTYFAHKSRAGFKAVILFLAAVFWAALITPMAFGNLHTRYTLLSALPYFLVGMAVEEIHRAAKNPFIAVISNGTADIVGLIAFFILALVPLPLHSTQSSWLKAVLVGIALWAMLKGTTWRRLLSLPWISVIGGMCYSIYLIHMPILEIGANLTSRIGAGLPYWVYFMIQSVLLFSAVLAVSMCFYLTIERPCMNKNWPRDLASWLQHLWLKHWRKDIG